MWPGLKPHLVRFLFNKEIHWAVRVYSDNAQMTSKRGTNKEIRFEPQASIIAEVMFLPRFDVLCALSEYTRTAKWNLFVLCFVIDVGYPTQS